MPLHIVFMGTPEFAVPTLEILIPHHHVVAVVTAPDKPRGRGLKLQASAVKLCALKHHIPLLQPDNLKDLNFLNSLKNLHADVFVVVAFRMLPKEVWNMPPLGTFNLHASLLPKYRGAAPIHFAIINGEKETGLTTFRIQQEIDTGEIALQTKIPIKQTDTAGILHDKMKILGADLMLQTLYLLEKNKLQLIPQSNEQASYAPKITKSFCQINWNNSCTTLYNFIRGLSPYPAAHTYFEINFKKTYCKILWAEEKLSEHTHQPGTILTDNKQYLKIATQDGYMDIQHIQPEGKKQMRIDEFLRGNKLTKNTCILS